MYRNIGNLSACFIEFLFHGRLNLKNVRLKIYKCLGQL